jgi:DNA-binding NarL/FixJ family response regulator
MAGERMTHKEKLERRKQIAQAIRDGKHTHVVAKQFGVGIGTIRSACIENGVIFSGLRRRSPVAA